MFTLRVMSIRLGAGRLSNRADTIRGDSAHPHPSDVIRAQRPAAAGCAARRVRFCLELGFAAWRVGHLLGFARSARCDCASRKSHVGANERQAGVRPHTGSLPSMAASPLRVGDGRPPPACGGRGPDGGLAGASRVPGTWTLRGGRRGSARAAPILDARARASASLRA